MREASVARKTNETDIQLTLALEGEQYRVDTGCGFLDHMLELFARHGGFGLRLHCQGDTRVDYHHTVEDIGIVLGQAFREALGDKRGINRYGSFLLPMDEALVLVAVDLSGRTTCCCDLTLPAQKVGILPRLLPRRGVHPPCQTAGGEEHPPHPRGGVQGIRPGDGDCGRDGQPSSRRAAEHQGRAVSGQFGRRKQDDCNY